MLDVTKAGRPVTEPIVVVASIAHGVVELLGPCLLAARIAGAVAVSRLWVLAAPWPMRGPLRPSPIAVLTDWE